MSDEERALELAKTREMCGYDHEYEGGDYRCCASADRAQAIHIAKALSQARAEGRREAIEECAALLMTGATRSNAKHWADCCRYWAKRIRALASKPGPVGGEGR